MDIARYIGLFLLKNHFCYVHGLGNLELKKKPATYDGLNLQSPQYDVVLTPTGSIDDTLANFIATNEQTSISKAANSLREFSINAKARLQEGGEVIIPSLGKFIYQNGKTAFITDPGFQHTPPAVPVAQVVRREEEPVKKQPVSNTTNANSSYAPSSSTPSNVNWGKIAMLALIVVIIAAAVIVGMKMLPSGNSSTTQTPDSSKTVVAQEIPAATQPPLNDSMPNVNDTAAVAKDTVQAIPVAPNGTMQYNVLLNTYDNLARAQKREKQLTGFKNVVKLVTKDSTSFHIVMPMSSMVSDTAHVLDSLRKKFNPKGVSIYK